MLHGGCNRSDSTEPEEYTQKPYFCTDSVQRTLGSLGKLGLRAASLLHKANSKSCSDVRRDRLSVSESSSLVALDDEFSRTHI
jgi:hypothetical protein